MSTDRRTRPPGVDVNPDAIRQARVAAGLSLADVAGSDISRSAVHRVETGKVRPSMRTLLLIAERTGEGIETFLTEKASSEMSPPTVHNLELARLEAMAGEGRYSEAAAKADQLLIGAEGAWIQARLHYWAGVVRVNLLEAAIALVHLRAAREAFVRARDVLMEVECLGWEAAALSIEEDRMAVDVALEALRRCRALDPSPAVTESRILGHLGGIHLSLHRWEDAIEAYKGALEAAGNIRNLASLTNIYDGMSIAHQGLGDLISATAYTKKAIALSSVMSNQVVLARLENNLGVLLLRSDQLREADAHLGKALEHCDEAGIEHGKSHVLLSLAQLAYAEREYQRADGLAREAIELAGRLGESLTQALAHQWLGKVLAAIGKDRQAGRTFEVALARLAALDVPRRLAECHREYADVLEQQGDLRGAIQHWREAADQWQAPVDEVMSSWTDRAHIGS